MYDDFVEDTTKELELFRSELFVNQDSMAIQQCWSMHERLVNV